MKNIIITLFVFFTYQFIFAFDFSNYKDTNFDEIGNIIEEANQDAPNEQFTLFVNFNKLEAYLLDYPKKITSDNKKILEIYAKTTDFSQYGQEFIEMHGYQTEILYSNNNYKFTFLWQNKLTKYLESENQKGKIINLYCIFGIVDNKNRNVILLVSEFQ